MTRRPTIGIPARTAGQNGATDYAVRATYVQAISMHRGLPVLLPPGDSSLVDHYASVCSGLLIPGGADVDPAIYNQAKSERLGPVDPELDALEIALIRVAFKRDMPILAICRGIQSLAVALGGSLVQDIPTQLQGQRHEVREHGRSHVAHEITLAPDSRVASLLGSTTTGVNSFHHQALDVVPDQLVVTGWSDDGVVEAVEAPGKRFVIALQCHPEELWRHTVPEFGNVFKALVDASANYESARDNCA